MFAYLTYRDIKLLELFRIMKKYETMYINIQLIPSV